MRILITGSTSGIGAATVKLLKLQYHEVIELNRSKLDLSDVQNVQEYQLPEVDCLINVAGGVQMNDVQGTVNVNFISPSLLTTKIYQQNNKALIVNVTSSYVDKYWGGALFYSVAKKAFAAFRKDFRIDYPDAIIAEVRPGLTKQKYNDDGSINDYFTKWREQNPDTTYLTPEEVAKIILKAIEKRQPDVYAIMPYGHTL